MTAISLRELTIDHKMSRKLKRVSAIASLMPYLFASQDFPAVQGQLNEPDLDIRTDFTLKTLAKPDNKAETLSESIHIVSPPNLSDLQSFDQFAGEDVLRSMETDRATSVSTLSLCFGMAGFASNLGLFIRLKSSSNSSSRCFES
jgi:hypothetical protein